MNVKKLPDVDKNWYLRVFKVADYESASQIIVKKMADPIWPT